MDADQWKEFLHSWQLVLRKQYSVSSQIWHEYGFGDPGKFDCFRLSDSAQSLHSEWLSRKNAIDIANFYSVSNGWPLFMGPDKVEIAPIEEIKLFREAEGPWFDLAVGTNEDYEPPSEGDDFNLSMSEFQTAIVLSRPVGSREIVLWLESGQICLFTYDSVLRYETLADFLRFNLEELKSRFN